MKLVSLLSILFVGLQFVTQQAFAIQEIEVVVADQSFNSSNKTVISEKEIKESQVNSLPTLISSEANVTISTSSFTPSSIFIRGGDSSHVLFLIDGIPTYDSSTMQRTIDMNSLNMRAIKKIEILKGPQVVLYGGQALSAVIKIETFPTELKNSTDILIQGGERFAEGSVSTQYKLSDLQALSGAVKYTNEYAVSPAQNSKKIYPMNVGSVNLSYINRFNPEKNYEALAKLEYSDNQSQIASIDDYTGKSLDTENFDTTTKTVNASVILRKTDFYSLSMSHQSTKRTFEQNILFSSSVLYPSGTNETYDGLLQVLRLDLNLLKTDKLKLDAGLSHTHEGLVYGSGSSEVKEYREYQGVFLKGGVNLTQDVLFEVGYRKELEKLNSLADTQQVGLSYKDNIKLEYAKAFKTPSLFQLYGYSGNANLAPERVETTALTFEGNIIEPVHNALTFFRADYENLLATRGNPRKYQNVGKANINGAEYFISYDSKDTGTRAQISFGYQEPKDVTQNNWLLKRSLRTAALKVNQTFSKSSLGLEVIHTGDRRDIIVTSVSAPTYTTLENYTLVHLVGNYKATEALNLFARAENIFSQEYQPSYGYYVDGPVVRAGLNYTLK